MFARTALLCAATRKKARAVGTAKSRRATTSTTGPSAAATAAAATSPSTAASPASSPPVSTGNAAAAPMKKSVEAGLKRERVARLVRQATADVKAAAAAASAPSPSANTRAPLAETRARSSAKEATGTGRPDAAASPATTTTTTTTTPDRVKDDAFTRLLDNFRATTAPFSDLDEVLGVGGLLQGEDASPSTAALAVRKKASSIVTCRDFHASMVCPKKFYLMSARPDLVPGSSIGEAVHLDDGVGFNELARRWDRLQFGSKAVLIAEVSHDAAVLKTEQVLIDYFTHQYGALGEHAPTLTLHRPAFSAPLQRDGAGPGDPALTLRARPCVLRYRPKENQWVILESQAVLDPLNASARAAITLQRLHFTMLALRLGLSQPHIPIAVRKRFLDVDPQRLTEASLNEGNELVSGAHPIAPIDVKRSGLLHIRQFMPGPITLMDCEPTRLVKYVQRVSLVELLEAERQSYAKSTGDKGGRGSRGGRSSGRGAAGFHHMGASGGAFDLQQLGDIAPAITPFYNAMVAAMKLSGKQASSARSTRTLRARESVEHDLFEAQQQLMVALLTHHTLPLVERSQEARQVQRWTAFSRDSPAGVVRSTWDHRAGDDDDVPGAGEATDAGVAGSAAGEATVTTRAAGGRGKHRSAPAATVPVVPCFSENLGGHCSRGDGCPFFAEGFCLPQRCPDPIKVKDNHLFTLPSTSVVKKSAWWADGSRTVRDAVYQHTTGAIKLTAPQLRYAKAVSEGQVAICPKEVDSFFSKLRYPLFIIDFEAVQFALPPFEKVIAYQSIPFQFSVDVFQHDVLTETPTHYDYLHFGPGYSPNVDPRPGCVKELIRIVREEREKKRLEMLASGQLDALREAEEAEAEAKRSGKGGAANARRKATTTSASTTSASARAARTASAEEPLMPWDGTFIAHFASFEKSCLEKLGQLEESYKDEIRGFYFVDTLELFKKGFVHPNANGSNSLKKLLPAICPDFQYGVFGVEAGDGASDGDGGAEDGSQSDEQKGENAMAVYRMWYHQEAGGTIQDLQRAAGRPVAPLSGSPDSGSSTSHNNNNNNNNRGSTDPAVLPMLKDTREEVWARLRIQLLEYCSLDTRALYEIMREIHREREAVRDMKPEDKSGWIFTTPLPREIKF